VHAQVVEGVAHHQGIGLTHKKGALAAGPFDERGHGAAGGNDAALTGARGVGVGGDEMGARGHQADGLGDDLQVVIVGLAEDDIFRVAVGDGIPRGVDGLGEAAFADDKSRALGLAARRALHLQKARRGHGRGIDALGGDIQAGALQAMREVAGGVHRIIGQHQILGVARHEPSDKRICAGDHGIAADQHAIHVDQVVAGSVHLVSLANARLATIDHSTIAA